MVIEVDTHPKSMASSMDNMTPRNHSSEYELLSTVAAADAMLKLSSSFMPQGSTTPFHANASSDGIEGGSVISLSDGSDTEVRSRSSSISRRERRFVPETRKDECYWQKRKKNNEAAKRSREKRRMNDVVLNEKIQEITQENNDLKRELEAIKQHFGLPIHQPFSPPSSSSANTNSLPNGNYIKENTHYQMNGESDCGRLNVDVPSKAKVPITQEEVDLATKQFLQQQRQLLATFPTNYGSLSPVIIAPKENHCHQIRPNMFLPVSAATSQFPGSQEVVTDCHATNSKDSQQFSSMYQSEHSGPPFINPSGETITNSNLSSRKRKHSQLSHSDEEYMSKKDFTRETVHGLHDPHQKAYNNHPVDTLATSSGSSSSGNGGSPVNDHSNAQKGIPHKLRHKFAHLSELSGAASTEILTNNDNIATEGSNGGSKTKHETTDKECVMIKEEANWSDSEESSLAYDSDPNNAHSNSSCGSSYEVKRKRNNEAARKCREKKRFLMNMRRVQSDYLESENGKLKKELKMLSNEVCNLKDLMDRKRVTEQNGGVFVPPPIEILKKQLIQRSKMS